MCTKLGERTCTLYGVPPPVIIDKFTADPHAVVIGDAYYIYPTVDSLDELTLTSSAGVDPKIATIMSASATA
jgi:hypothetical protein